VVTVRGRHFGGDSGTVSVELASVDCAVQLHNDSMCVLTANSCRKVDCNMFTRSLYLADRILKCLNKFVRYFLDLNHVGARLHWR